MLQFAILQSWRIIITARVYCFTRVSEENLRVGLKYIILLYDRKSKRAIRPKCTESDANRRRLRIDIYNIIP